GESATAWLHPARHHVQGRCPKTIELPRCRRRHLRCLHQKTPSPAARCTCATYGKAPWLGDLACCLSWDSAAQSPTPEQTKAPDFPGQPTGDRGVLNSARDCNFCTHISQGTMR